MSTPEKETKADTGPVSLEETRSISRPSASFPSLSHHHLSPSVEVASDFPLPTPGQILAGRYMVFDYLGSGGMGVVLAAYDTRLDRRVALKLLAPEKTSNVTIHDGEARLVREAQAMARLNHPNVVAVYDAGSLEDGALFIAMEYVEGTTLRRWREQQPRTWREVLKAYLAAGRGLSAAHAAGLIHRDFKPDNVLVGEDGRARVMDFGLARPAHGTANEEPVTPPSPEAFNSEITATGALLGTPKYMAPELVRGEAADVRSDIYAFCVSLYEALYGQLPFPEENMVEYTRARKEGRITPPPVHSEVPAWVTRTVLHGLEADPLQRTASIDELLAALEEDPVARRRDRYRALAAAVAGTVLAGLAIWGWAGQRGQEPVCSRVERRLAGVWDPAVKVRVNEALLATGVSYAQATSERVSAALDSYVERWVRQGTALCEAEQSAQLPRLAALREFCLERRLSRLHATTELLVQGADKELLEKAVQAVYSLPPLEDCVDDQTLTAAVPLPENPEERAQVKALLEKADRAEALLGTGKYKEGVAAGEALLKQVEQVNHAPLHGQILFMVARLKEALGDYAGAEKLAHEALTYAADGKDAVLMSRTLSFLTVVKGVRLKQLQQAEMLVPVVRAVARSTGDSLTQALALSQLGHLLMNQGKYNEAWESHRRALELREKVLGPEHPDVASSISNLASAAWWMGRYDEAVEKAERAVALQSKALGPEHPEVIKTLMISAGTLFEVGRYEDALKRHERVLELQEKVLGAQHPSVPISLTNIAITLMSLGRYEEARQRSERAMTLAQKRTDPLKLAAAHISLGAALSELGRHDEAQRQQESALALRREALGPEHALVAESLRFHGIELAHLRKFREARTELDRALIIHEKALGKDHPDLTYPLVALGDLLLDQGKPAKALPFLERAQKLTPEGNIRAEVRFSLARALWAAKRSERPRAVTLATEARDYWQRLGHAPRLERTSQWLSSHSR
jgi:tetratricopeptide (TPR) repeat protein